MDLDRAYREVRSEILAVARAMAKGRVDLAEEYESLGSLAFMRAVTTYRSDCGSFGGWVRIQTMNHIRASRRREDYRTHRQLPDEKDGPTSGLEFMALLSNDAREVATTLIVEAQGDVRYALIRAKEYLYGVMGRTRFESALNEVKHHCGVT